jgi:hypothetical protein
MADGRIDTRPEIISFVSIARSSLLYCARFHVDQFPDVAVYVLEPMSVHETVVLWFIVGCPAGGNRLANQLIDFGAALRRQANKHFGTLGCVTDFFGSKRLELIVSQEHHEYVLAYNHAGGSLVSKLRIERETKLGKELDGPIKVFYWKIHENLSGHVFPFQSQAIPNTRWISLTSSSLK